MIEITEKPISPEDVVNKAKTDDSGCVVTYVGVIRRYSRGKKVASVEYRDTKGEAAGRLQGLVNEARQRWPVENIAITHRIGKLNVGDINIVVAVASGHRREGFAAARYIINGFKRKLPTEKTETYLGSGRAKGE
jgi:molybdopterin synthase catalytic subunit